MNIDDNFDEKKKICLSFSSTSIFLSLVNKCTQKSLIYLSDNNKYLFNIKNEINKINPKIKVIIIHEFDCAFFSNVSPTKNIISKRIEAFYELIFSENKKKIFLLSVNSIIQKVIPLNEIQKKRLIISKEDKNIYELVIKFLDENMYEKVEFVRNKGEFAIRGDIVDIFSPNEKKPVRISFNFEDIESLNFFNPENQKSEEKIDNYSLFIASEILFNDSTIKF